MAQGWLLDTNVVSALNSDRTDLSPKSAAWLARREAASFVSVVTIIEIEAGISALRLLGAGTKAERLQIWFDDLKMRLLGSLIDIDEAVATATGRLKAEARAGGLQPDMADVLIAATALVRDLTLVTRNVRHFERFGIDVIDPFSI